MGFWSSLEGVGVVLLLVNVYILESIECLHLPGGHHDGSYMLIPLQERLDVPFDKLIKYVRKSALASAKNAISCSPTFFTLPKLE